MFKITFHECDTIFVDQWFGYLNGETKEGEKFNLHFNLKKNKFDSAKKNATEWIPVWVFDEAFNNGEVTIYQVRGEKYKPTQIRIRSVGKQGKVEISGKFKRKLQNEWNLVL